MATRGSPAESSRAASRRDLAVARVLDPARERAETRVQRFLDAALELMHGSSGKEFTVQEIVERSGQSLRSFYQYFDGKYELLLALFEDSVRSTAQQLRELVDDEKTPLDRLHRFAVEYHRLCRPAPKGRGAKRAPTAALGEFAQQLLSEHPHEASRAFVPLVTLLEELLNDGVSAGVLRANLPVRRTAGVVLESIMFGAFAATIAGTSQRAGAADSGEELWDVLFHGLQA